MHKLRAILGQTEIRWFCFILGIILLGWPLLSIVDQYSGKNIFIYLFAVWGILIFVIFLLTNSIRLTNINGTTDENRNPEA